MQGSCEGQCGYETGCPVQVSPVQVTHRNGGRIDCSRQKRRLKIDIEVGRRAHVP